MREEDGDIWKYAGRAVIVMTTNAGAEALAKGTMGFPDAAAASIPE